MYPKGGGGVNSVKMWRRRRRLLLSGCIRREGGGGEEKAWIGLQESFVLFFWKRVVALESFWLVEVVSEAKERVG